MTSEIMAELQVIVALALLSRSRYYGQEWHSEKTSYRLTTHMVVTGGSR